MLKKLYHYNLKIYKKFKNILLHYPFLNKKWYNSYSKIFQKIIRTLVIK